MWSKIETVKDNNDIEHPSVRSCLKYLGIKDGIEIHHTGDLPARSGLGSSSSFTVGLLNALSALQGKSFNKAGLALESVNIERNVMKENVGIQDQIVAAYGGFNKTTINNNGSFFIEPIISSRLEELQSHLLLFFTGVSRTASDIAEQQIAIHKSGSKDSELKTMQSFVGEALNIINSRGNLLAFGHLLHESWKIKKTLANNISPQFVDDIYTKALNCGAIGGKLLGAGGGGFMLFFAPPQYHDAIRYALNDLLCVPFNFENDGSKIIYGL